MVARAMRYRSRLARLVTVLVLVVLGVVAMSGCDGHDPAVAEWSIEIFAADAPGLGHTSWGSPIVADDPIEAQSLLVIHAADITGWQGNSRLAITPDLQEQLDQIADEYFLERPIFRMNLGTEAHWGWVSFSAVETLSPTPILVYPRLERGFVALETWGMETADGEPLAEAARRYWALGRG